MKCTDCRYCILKDYGYSNYTVEGTTVDCLKNKNPDFPKDRFYGKEPAIAYADQCDTFSAGESVTVDCDRNDGALENYSDDEEIKALLREQ